MKQNNNDFTKFIVVTIYIATAAIFAINLYKTNFQKKPISATKQISSTSNNGSNKVVSPQKAQTQPHRVFNHTIADMERENPKLFVQIQKEINNILFEDGFNANEVDYRSGKCITQYSPTDNKILKHTVSWNIPPDRPPECHAVIEYDANWKIISSKIRC